MKTRSRSEALFARAQARIPGGVNSPVRAFRGVGGTPRVHRARRRLAHFRRRREFVYRLRGLVGAAAAGASPAAVIDALREALEGGTSFGAPTEREVELAELIAQDGAVDGDGAAGEFRHRGDHERAAAGARIHGPRSDDQVRRLLSRACRFAAGEGGFGHGDAGDRRYGGRAEGFRGDDDRAAVQFDRRGGEGVRGTRAIKSRR